MNQATIKSDLRKRLRAARREHADAQPDSIRALLFHAPPRPVLARIEEGAVIGLYHSTAHEAPSGGYARYFHENGHAVALPRFTSKASTMGFAEHTDPFAGTDLEQGPFGARQPNAAAQALTPDVVFVPLVGFTAAGDRLGQGGGHYDRWLAEHPGVMKIGLAWDVQLVEPEDALPTEPHDIALDAVVTPTRIYGKL
jgi:5-formyltetrahydrofolate cyclo-ligase